MDADWQDESVEVGEAEDDPHLWAADADEEWDEVEDEIEAHALIALEELDEVAYLAEEDLVVGRDVFGGRVAHKRLFAQQRHDDAGDGRETQRGIPCDPRPASHSDNHRDSDG